MTQISKAYLWQDLAMIVDQIDACLKEENALLAKSDFAAVRALQDRKEDLVCTYEKLFFEIRRKVTEEGLTDEEKAQLAKLNFGERANRFHEACQDNVVHLEAQQNVHEFMVDQIVQAAKTQRAVNKYDTNGQMTQIHHDTMSVIVNKQV